MFMQSSFPDDLATLRESRAVPPNGKSETSLRFQFVSLFFSLPSYILFRAISPRAITNAWISLVPSPIIISGASR